MPSKSLFKVQKQITQKKGKSAPLHPESRNAKRLRRASAREDRVKKGSSERQIINEPHLWRLRHMQMQLDIGDYASDNGSFPLQSLVADFINNTAVQLEELQAERRADRPPSNKENLRKMELDQLRQEYVSGFWMPDLRNANTLKLFRIWDQDWSSLNVITFVRVMQDGTVSESKFPPKGLY